MIRRIQVKYIVIKVRRNPNNGHRSEFNADKTKLLRPSLYTYFSNDESISFCYYSDETMENDDETILKIFHHDSN